MSLFIIVVITVNILMGGRAVQSKAAFRLGPYPLLSNYPESTAHSIPCEDWEGGDTEKDKQSSSPLRCFSLGGETTALNVEPAGAAHGCHTLLLWAGGRPA